MANLFKYLITKKIFFLFFPLAFQPSSCSDNLPGYIVMVQGIMDSKWKMEYDDYTDLVGEISIQLLAKNSVSCLNEEVSILSNTKENGEEYLSFWKERNNSIFISLKLYDDRIVRGRFKEYYMFLKYENSKLSGNLYIKAGFNNYNTPITGTRIY